MRRPRRDREMSPEERSHWKREAYRARLSQGAHPEVDRQQRVRLFEHIDAADDVSRPTILMAVADNFERSGKREAAERCYLQIKERFPQSPQAEEAGRRLTRSAHV